MIIILCLSDALGTSVILSRISSTSESDSSKPWKFSGVTGWLLHQGARTEERGQVFLYFRLLFGAVLQPFPKGMAELERANEVSASSTMAPNRNKLGYCKQKWKHHLMQNLIPRQVMFLFFPFFQRFKSVVKKNCPNIEFASCDLKFYYLS